VGHCLDEFHRRPQQDIMTLSKNIHLLTLGRNAGRRKSRGDEGMNSERRSIWCVTSL
jgi:hypothetical protein